ncbi:MAG TPA: GNAT family N-acetyltransferase [Actinomycetota bacterium]|nr:GNAT family N-acetyltransferase [Actinomycetota bacterium]
MELRTERLVVRPWRADDAEDAVRVYGDEDVARWLSPAMQQVEDLPQMRELLAEWDRQAEELVPPAGRWAVERTSDGRVVGGIALMVIPPWEQDLEFAWQLAPDARGQGYAVEAAHALARWAFGHPGTDEVFAVMHTTNRGGIAMARRLGMEWVGETEKYYDRTLQVYRLRSADLGA